MIKRSSFDADEKHLVGSYAALLTPRPVVFVSKKNLMTLNALKLNFLKQEGSTQMRINLVKKSPPPFFFVFILFFCLLQFFFFFLLSGEKVSTLIIFFLS